MPLSLLVVITVYRVKEPTKDAVVNFTLDTDSLGLG